MSGALGEECAYISFHGGGEPTLDMALLRHCVEFARAYSAERAPGRVTIVTSLVTNGYLSDATATWIAENIDSVQVSLDGPSAIQDRQRPVQNGAPSHNRVEATVKKFQGHVPDLMIKATVSSSSVVHMADIAEYMCRTFDIPRFHFGPVLSAGRGRSEEFGQPDAEEFFAGYLAAQEVANRFGRTIVVSGAQAQCLQLKGSGLCWRGSISRVRGPRGGGRLVGSAGLR
jgi:sulfatase maturation enzyme AslB (radical SAM superfamily)